MDISSGFDQSQESLVIELIESGCTTDRKMGKGRESSNAEILRLYQIRTNLAHSWPDLTITG